MNNIGINITKIHSNGSCFDMRIPAMGQRLSKTEKDRSIKKGITNKLICLILFPSLPQGCQTQDHSQKSLWANISLPGQVWGDVESLGGTFFLCSVFCASLQGTLNKRLHHVDCVLGGSWRLSHENQQHKMLEWESSTLLKMKVWLI